MTQKTIEGIYNKIKIIENCLEDIANPKSELDLFHKINKAIRVCDKAKVEILETSIFDYKSAALELSKKKEELIKTKKKYYSEKYNTGKIELNKDNERLKNEIQKLKEENDAYKLIISRRDASYEFEMIEKITEYVRSHNKADLYKDRGWIDIEEKKPELRTHVLISKPDNIKKGCGCVLYWISFY